MDRPSADKNGPPLHAAQREEVLASLAGRHALLYIDRCDHLSQAEHTAPFADLLSDMLRRAPRAKLLLTCRRSLGIPGEQPLTLNVPELSTAEAQQMLRRMDPYAAPRLDSSHTLSDALAWHPIVAWRA
eukprot:2275418-Prymnesium_polylepis.2